MKSIGRDKTHPILMFRPSDCSVRNDDGKHVFVGKVYGTKNIEEDHEKVQAVLRMFPRLNAEEFKSANDGIYTWLLYANETEEIQFVATEVVSPYEIGTRHQSLAYNERINALNIYGGGELMKTKDHIEFNLLSGTYSKPLMEANYTRVVKRKLIETFQTFFPEAEYDDSEDSYIHKVKRVPNVLLDMYKDIGYTIRTFDTYDECAKFHNTFWNIDFSLEHYKTKLQEAKNDEEKSTMGHLYIDSLERMMELLAVKEAKKGGKTRRNRKHRSSRRSKL
jgi:hypothetical protein